MDKLEYIIKELNNVKPFNKYVKKAVAKRIDSFLSLDENLQELYDECIKAIINSTFYELP